VAQAVALQPDLVVMDVDLPGDDGASATRRIKAALPATTVVIFARSY